MGIEAFRSIIMQNYELIRFNIYTLLAALLVIYMSCLLSLLTISSNAMLYPDLTIVITIFFSIFEKKYLSLITVIIYCLLDDFLHKYQVTVSTIICAMIYIFIINNRKRIVKTGSGYMISIYSALLIALAVFIKSISLLILYHGKFDLSFIIKLIMSSITAYCILYILYSRFTSLNLIENARST